MGQCPRLVSTLHCRSHSRSPLLTRQRSFHPAAWSVVNGWRLCGLHGVGTSQGGTQHTHVPGHGLSSTDQQHNQPVANPSAFRELGINNQLFSANRLPNPPQFGRLAPTRVGPRVLGLPGVSAVSSNRILSIAELGYINLNLGRLLNMSTLLARVMKPHTMQCITMQLSVGQFLHENKSCHARK